MQCSLLVILDFLSYASIWRLSLQMNLKHDEDHSEADLFSCFVVSAVSNVLDYWFSPVNQTEFTIYSQTHLKRLPSSDMVGEVLDLLTL